jgi:hypothetical protein
MRFMLGMRRSPGWLLSVTQLVNRHNLRHRCNGRWLSEKSLAAMFAAKIKRLAVSFGAKLRPFIDRHAANGIFGHSTFPSK